MLVKSLTDDLAWKVQRELVNGYFRAIIKRDTPTDNVLKMFPLLEENYKRLLYYRLEKQLTQTETARILRMSTKRIVKMEKELQLAGVIVPPVHNTHNKFNLDTYRSIMSVKCRIYGV